MEHHYPKYYFKDMSYAAIIEWVDKHQPELEGGALFVSATSFFGAIIKWFERRGQHHYGFTPSHVGSLVIKDGQLALFDMKPLFARTQDLAHYLATTNEEYVLMPRHFELDVQRFSKEILKYDGTLYPFLSAISSVFHKFPSKRRKHCSELHLACLQHQGLYRDVNSEITPDELYKLMY